VPAQSDAVWTIAGVPVNNAGAANMPTGLAGTDQLSVNQSSSVSGMDAEIAAGVIDLTVAQPDMLILQRCEPAAFTLTGIALIGLAWRRKSAR